MNSTSMLKQVENPCFEPINRGYNTVFHPNRLSLGVVVPLETYSTGQVPSMTRHVERVQLADDPKTPPQPIHMGSDWERNICGRF